MTLTAAEVSGLTSTLEKWELAEYIFAALVTIGCFGEFVAEFTEWFTKGKEESKKRLEKCSTLLLVGALALELVCLVKTNQLSGRVIGSLNELVTGADEKARKALGDSSTAITQSGQATIKAGLAEQASSRAAEKSGKAEGTASNAMALARDTRREADSFEKDIVSAKKQAAEAESHLMEALRQATNAQRELTRLKTPRSLDEVQQERIRERTRQFRGTVFDLYVSSEEEAGNFMEQIDRLLRSAEWQYMTPAADILVRGKAGSISGGGVLIEVFRDHAADRIGMAAVALRDALLAEGIDCKVVANADIDKNHNAVHVEIGSKPVN